MFREDFNGLSSDDALLKFANDRYSLKHATNSCCAVETADGKVFA